MYKMIKSVLIIKITEVAKIKLQKCWLSGAYLAEILSLIFIKKVRKINATIYKFEKLRQSV